MYDTRFLRSGGDVLGGFRAHFLFWAKDKQMKHSIDERIREIAVRTAEENSLELVQVEIGGSTKNPTVRVFIDKPGGVTH